MHVKTVMKGGSKMCHESTYRFGGHYGNCGCEHPGHHATMEQWPHHRGCCAHGYPPRHFPTREEIMAQLEQYLKDLQAEAKGVQEHIAELKKGQE